MTFEDYAIKFYIILLTVAAVLGLLFVTVFPIISHDQVANTPEDILRQFEWVVKVQKKILRTLVSKGELENAAMHLEDVASVFPTGVIAAMREDTELSAFIITRRDEDANTDEARAKYDKIIDMLKVRE